MENVNIKERIDYLYTELRNTAATFVYKPDEIAKIKQCIYELQDQCNHEYQNGRCIYCRKEQDNADEEKRYL